MDVWVALIVSGSFIVKEEKERRCELGKEMS